MATTAAQPKLTTNSLTPVANQSERMAKARKSRQPVNPDETKAAKFVRLAKARVPKAIKAIARVTNLSDTGNYEYTPEQRDKVKAAIAKACKTMTDAFDNVRRGEESFTL